jgi:hypothetical protein
MGQSDDSDEAGTTVDQRCSWQADIDVPAKQRKRQQMGRLQERRNAIIKLVVTCGGRCDGQVRHIGPWSRAKQRGPAPP